jgi:hypothetical protein
MTFNYVGQLRPDQTITAEIQRADVTATIRFEVRVQDRKGDITYERLPTPNMKLRSEIHAEFSTVDPRIPPYEEYIDEDNRPYYNECLIFFRLRDNIEITDLSSNDPSVAGGDNGHGFNIPPIFLPPASIDLSGGSKVLGASRGPVQGPGEENSSSETTDSDDDQIFRIAQAIRRGQKIQVAISGFFKGYQDRDSVITFRQPYFGPPPDSLRTLFNIAHAAIEAMSPTLGSSGIPNALMWSKHPFTEADIDAAITKSNDGLLVTFSRQDMPGAPIASFEQAYTLKLPSGLRISFGAEKNASDFTITGYLGNATASILESGLYGDPWRIFLMAMPWRDTETGEIWTSASPSHPPDLEPRLPGPVVPRNAIRSLCYTETDRPKEMQRLLKFGRDSAWPLSVSVASTLDSSNSVTVTSSIDYEECDSSRAWFMAKFLAAAQKDQMFGLPALFLPTTTWTLKLRKEDASFRGLLYEYGASTPEYDGCPCYLVYGRRATIKLRCETIEVADRALT